MPYDYKNMKKKVQNISSQVSKALKDFKRRQSTISAKTTGSIYSVIKQTVANKKYVQCSFFLFGISVTNE